MGILTVTEKAIKEVKRLITEQEMDPTKVALRVRILGGGCSGYSTKLDIDEDFSEEKDELDVIDGINVAVDKRSAMYLEGATVDFYNDINKMGFAVDNPNAKSTCACKSSFSM